MKQISELAADSPVGRKRRRGGDGEFLVRKKRRR
jgi:hypothetical protein